MKLQIRSYSHAVGEFNYHIQLTPAYRRGIFESEKVQKLVFAYLRAKAEELKVRIASIECGPDHIHIFVADCKNIAPSKLVQQMKGFSSRMMRKNHLNIFRNFLWGKKFWSEGYFCRSIGATTTEAVKYYIEHSQEKHWNNFDYEVQLGLENF
jgi:putative transposase